MGIGCGTGRSRGWSECYEKHSTRLQHFKLAEISSAFLHSLIRDCKPLAQVLRSFDFVHDGHGVILRGDAAFALIIRYKLIFSLRDMFRIACQAE